LPSHLSSHPASNAAREPSESRRLAEAMSNPAFFFVYSYSNATYVDHGGVHFAQVSCPQSAQ